MLYLPFKHNIFLYQNPVNLWYAIPSIHVKAPKVLFFQLQPSLARNLLIIKVQHSTENWSVLEWQDKWHIFKIYFNKGVYAVSRKKKTRTIYQLIKKLCWALLMKKILLGKFLWGCKVQSEKKLRYRIAFFLCGSGSWPYFMSKK